jgi:2-methylcitrate dehydratase PrpD
MKPMTRRQVLQGGALAAAATSSLPSLLTAGDIPLPSLLSSETPSSKGVTHKLAYYLVNARYQDLPEAVIKEGIRTLVNWVGVAVGGSQHETIDRAVKALTPLVGKKEANLFGRLERFDLMNAAFINGVSSHIFDYDDTHLKTIIHPGGPVLATLFALAQNRPISGQDFLNAMILGIETECRIGNMVYPNHYDIGWHITGTAGVFGAAAAAGVILGLNEQQMVWALGLAASQPVGLRESFGSMTKSFNPGRAASNGLFAAFLAEQNYTSSEGMIEAKRGWANTISTKQDYRELIDDLGFRFESALNSYKPFACGIVIHPAIDAAIQLRNNYSLKAEQIASIDLRVHPLVLELTGKKTPRLGLEGKFSVYHSVAVSLIDGAAGEKQYSDEKVRNPQIIALRELVTATVDPSIKAEQVDMTITTKEDRKLHIFIEHALGSLEKPMTNDQLETKFLDLTDGILSKKQSQNLLKLCWTIEKLPSADSIIKAGSRQNS